MNQPRSHAPLSATRWLRAVGLGILLLGFSGVTGLMFGSTRLDFGDVLAMDIMTQARLPRVLFAGIVGAVLAASGAVFQAVLRNPLADPYILGVSGGAALGGSLMVAIGAGVGSVFGPPAAAFVGALGSLLFLFSVARFMPGGLSTYVLLLSGVIFNAFASAVIMFLKSVLSAQKAQELLFYLMGSLNVEGTAIEETGIVGLAVVVILGGLFVFARDLNVLTLGDDAATALGVDVPRTRTITVVLASLGVAIAVAYTGLIGFVGLVVPHGIRLVFGADHRLLMPMCALGGASFLILADTLARVSFMLFETSLPVGVLTATIGAPLFFIFLRKNLKNMATG